MRRIAALVSVVATVCACSAASVASASGSASGSSSASGSASASANTTAAIAPGRHVTVDARVALRAYTAFVEQRLGSVLTALSAVAAGSDARSGQWDRISAPLAAIRARVGTAAVVWYVEPDGSYFTTEEGLTNKSLADRSYFAALMAGRDAEGPLVVSKASGRSSTIVAAPIRANGHVIGGLGASIDLVKLSKVVQTRFAFPSSVDFYAIDSAGRYALNKATSLIFSFPSKLGSPSLRAAVHTMLSTSSGRVSYRFDGASRTVLYMRSRATGWTFAIGVGNG